MGAVGGGGGLWGGGGGVHLGWRVNCQLAITEVVGIGFVGLGLEEYIVYLVCFTT